VAARVYPHNIFLIHVQFLKNVYPRRNNSTRQAITQLEAQEAFVKAQNDERLEYKTEWHKKTVMSLMCLVLFFIGAPLGALIQKGGFGLPVVISGVAIFSLFYLYRIFYGFGA